MSNNTHINARESCHTCHTREGVMSQMRGSHGTNERKQKHIYMRGSHVTHEREACHKREGERESCKYERESHVNE